MKYLNWLFLFGCILGLVGAGIKKDYLLGWVIINTILLDRIVMVLEKK